MLRLLVARGAHVDQRDGDGRTALHRAAEANHVDMIRALLALGADVDARDENGWAPVVFGKRVAVLRRCKLPG